MLPQTVQEFRFACRVGVRTPVITYQFTGNGSVARSRAWTDNISSTGVKLITEKSLSGSIVYLRVMLPDLKDRVIVCEVVRDDTEFQNRMQNWLSDLHHSYYGLRYIGIADEPELKIIEDADQEMLKNKEQ